MRLGHLRRSDLAAGTPACAAKAAVAAKDAPIIERLGT
jgi:hypothetical protein